MSDHNIHAGHDMHTAVEHGDVLDTASDDAGDDMNHHAKEHDSLHDGKILLA